MTDPHHILGALLGALTLAVLASPTSWPAITRAWSSREK